MIIGKRFTFDAAHHLEHYHGACHQKHGHTYTLDVEVYGVKNQNSGMVMDLHALGDIVIEVLKEFDHQDLNLIPMPDDGLPFPVEPTCENLLIVLKHRIKNLLPLGVDIHSMILQEGKGGWARC